VEALEDRHVPATLHVTSFADNGTGSLRAALDLANSTPEADVIDFAVAGPIGPIVIVLQSALPNITAPLTIRGLGADKLTLARNTTRPAFKLFVVSERATVSISGLKLTGGSGFLGAMGNVDGDLTLSDCWITGNEAAFGGGINNSGTLRVSNCTFSGNRALGAGSGAGSGGAIFNNGTLIVTNSTFSHNSAQRFGGAIAANTGTAQLTNCTLADNKANDDTAGNGTGGGLYQGPTADVRLTNCLIVANTNVRLGTPDDVSGNLDPASTHNIIGDGSGMSGISNGTMGNQVGSTNARLTANLGPLWYNGGTTPTRALREGSIAVNTGTEAGAPATDQRGVPREGAPDVGAFELDTSAPSVQFSRLIPALTNRSEIPVDVTFSEAVTGFTAEDVTVTNGTVVDFAGSGSSYTITIRPTDQGAVTVRIAAGVAQDTSGNGNLASGALTHTYDSIRPTAVISSTAPQATGTSPIPFTIEFSEPVVSFSIVLSNWSEYQWANTATTFTGSFTPRGPGTAGLGLGGNIMDAAGNELILPPPLSFLFDPDAPSVALTSPVSPSASTSPIPVTATFNEEVSDFDASDVFSSNATVANFAGSGTTYTFELIPTAAGEVSVVVPAGAARDVAGNANEASAPLKFNFSPPAPSPFPNPNPSPSPAPNPSPSPATTPSPSAGPSPSPATSIRAVVVKGKRGFEVRVFDAETGVLRFRLTRLPRWVKSRPRIAIQDLDSDSTTDLVLLARVGRKLRRAAYSGSTGAPLPGA
jgi:hypothetical protein